MLQFNHTLSTGGNGLWSIKAKDVSCTVLDVPYINEGETFGELRVYFDRTSWDVYNDGLVYTDKKFLKQLRNKLTEQGFVATDVDYSEQGMQGINYVSLDVGEEFLCSWLHVVY
jgi:hypothetical protein